MNAALWEDQFRVTSIPHRSQGMVIFTGVPLAKNSYKQNSGKYYVTIKTEPENLPVMPAVGQHWAVKGVRLIESRDTNGYMMQQHTYTAPEHIECSLPETGEQLINFIAKEPDFKGIGESKARALWDSLGTNLHTIISKDTEDSRASLRKLLSEDSIDSLYTGYAKYQNLAYCNWMSQNNIPSSIQQRLIKHHGHKTVEAIRINPFILIGFGMPFDKVDELEIAELDLKENDDRRLSAALEIAIRSQIEAGHTFTTVSQLTPQLKKLLKDNTLVTEAFKAGYHKAQFVYNEQTETYHPTAQLLMESVVAKRLSTLSHRTNLFNQSSNKAFHTALSELPYDLAQKQIEAVTTCLDNAVSCITGGAGTGKTTVLRTALRSFHAVGYEIHGVALSGRAAMRLHESTGFITKTIARLLREDALEPDSEYPNQLLVIDEASMIDLPTMYRIINHCHPDVKIILVGDPNQLPPIGCGKVLSDIIESGTITNTALNIVKRQKGSTGIPEYSKLINEGEVPASLSSGNIHFHDVQPDNIVDTCTALFMNDTENSRVMAPTKKLVGEINERIQAAANPNGEKMVFDIHGETFYREDLRQGDTVLFTKNNYDEGIQNGSLGKLISVETGEETYGQVQLDTGEVITITQQLMDCMERGYAITLHKAQGSQWPRIIIALKAGRIVDRAWLYTAITRAEAEVHIVGNAHEFEKITKAPSNAHKRNSFLLHLLQRNKTVKPASF